MIKLKFILLLCCCVQVVHAQHFKMSATQGIGYDANKKNDSLFFAKNYLVSQLRVGYHYGKLGVIWNNTYINQTNVNIEQNADDRIPDFITPIGSQGFFRNYSNVHTFNTSLGLELCVPLLRRKAQLNFYSTYGLSFSKSDSVAFYDANLPLYSHKVNRQSSGCFQAGFSFNYKFNQRFGAKWQNEYDCYNLNYNAVDIRKIPNAFTGSQRKNLFVSSIGVQYTF
jgi:hypothetical protein